MLKIYIKNHLKMMFRKKWIIILMVLFPLLLIGTLSSVFGGLMNREIALQEVMVGYSIKENIDFPTTSFETVFTENSIKIEKVNSKDKEQQLHDQSIVAFIEISEDGYTIYKTSSYPTELAVIETLCYSYFWQFQYQIINVSQDDIKLEIEMLNIAVLPSAVDYYGIIEIVYFTWFGFMALTSILSSERKYRILDRIKVTAVPNWTIYLAKLIPATIVCFIEMTIAIILSYLLFGVHWGNLIISLGIVLLSINAALAFSLMVFTFCKQILMGVAIMYVSGFVMGYIGGSFQMYMFAPFNEGIKSLSPIYHTNRALVELSTSGSSQYTVSCISILILIFIVCSMITMLKMRRKEGVV